MKITILVDNYLTQPSSLRMRLLGEWGFAAYVHGYRILYDTGLSGATLLNNMKALGISLDEPEVLVFIHRYMDHTGGLKAFSLRQDETSQDCGSRKPLCQSLRRSRQEGWR